MATLAEQKKAILPYLQRAEEIDSLNPKVAYYCRVYAIEQGIAIPDRLPEITDVLGAVMDKLQHDKSKLKVTDEDAQECEAFAVTVFNRADRQDRAGKAGPTTIKAFYVATIFIEILRQFGELPPDMVERQQYAAWKAADIRKALREGRVPTAGPPVNEDMLDLPEVPGNEAAASQAGLNSAPSAQSGPGSPSKQSPPAHPSSAHRPGLSPQLQPPRFRPGSKVYFNAFDGKPEKGTVVSSQPSQYGNLCQVALSQKIVEVPETRLAFDFASGDAIVYHTKDGLAQHGHIDRSDAAKWPIAHLLTLENGQSLATTDDALSPAETLQTHDTARRNEPAGGSAPDAPTPAGNGPSAFGPTAGTPSGGPPLNDTNAATQDPEADLAQDPQGHQEQGQDTSASSEQAHNSREEGPDDAMNENEVHPPSNQEAGPVEGSSTSDQFYPAPESSQPVYPDLGGAPSGRFHSSAAEPTNPPDPSTNSHPAAGMFPDHTGHEGPRLQPQHHIADAGPSNAAGAYPTGFGFQSHGLSRPEPKPEAAHQPSIQAITEAQKYSKYAASSLGFEDVATAVKYLQQAMDLLRGQ